MKVSHLLLTSLLFSAVPGTLLADDDHPHRPIELRLKALENALSQNPTVDRKLVRRLLSEILAARRRGKPAAKSAPAPKPGAKPVSKPVRRPASPARVAGRTLADCKARLSAQGGGWCEMRGSDAHPGISAVWPSLARDHDLHGTVGPEAILGARCGAAFDRAALDFYFSCGGHQDYGGNEVYRFDLKGGKWERLTDPSPLTHVYTHRGQYRRQVDIREVPSSSHSYDGLLWDRTTRTFYYMTMAQYSHRGLIARNLTDEQTKPAEQGGLVIGGRHVYQYQFNPSRTDTRDGLSSLTWRRVGDVPDLFAAKSVQWPDGEIWMAGNSRVYRVRFGANRRISSLEPISHHGNAGDGLLSYDPRRNRVWAIASKWLWSYDKNGKRGTTYDTVPKGAGKSLTIDDRGILYSWDGVDRVYSFNPDEAGKGWQVHDWSGRGPSGGVVGRTYSKFQHIGDGFFAGISSHRTGFWVYLHH